MSVAYLTTDEVNASLAGKFAAACGLELFLVHPDGTAPVDGARAIVYDLDFLPERHAASLAAAASLPRRSPALAVHGYNIDRGLARRLRAAGVVVARRLTSTLFERLHAVLQQAKRGAAAGRAPQSEPADLAS
jgi:hypothetical protein